jgi:hypothetical protein
MALMPKWAEKLSTVGSCGSFGFLRGNSVARATKLPADAQGRAVFSVSEVVWALARLKQLLCASYQSKMLVP